MKMRKLASVQRIVNIEPIPNADAIEKITVLGWEVVCKKGEFKVGDSVVYIEIDSLLPEGNPNWEFLRDRKFRVRTIKLRKQISQGLVLPLSVLPKRISGYNEGDDVTEILKVRKFDPQADKEREIAEQQLKNSKNKFTSYMSKFGWFRKLFIWLFPKSDKGWPKFIKKTDEDRIQLFPNFCEQYSNKTFCITEKVDGQSATYVLAKTGRNKFDFMVCSRNLRLRKPDNSSYWTIAQNLNIEQFLRDIINDKDYVALQGEIIGTGIQGNKYKVDGYDFYAFNLIYPNCSFGASVIQKYFDNFAFMRLKTVPVIEPEFKLLSSIPEMIEYAKGKSVLYNTLREGVVIRNYNDNNPISVKVINPDFLLKNEE